MYGYFCLLLWHVNTVPVQNIENKKSECQNIEVKISNYQNIKSIMSIQKYSSIQKYFIRLPCFHEKLKKWDSELSYKIKAFNDVRVKIQNELVKLYFTRKPWLHLPKICVCSVFVFFGNTKELDLRLFRLNKMDFVPFN